MMDEHPDETFYGFGIYHEPLWGYIFPAGNSEEGLARATKQYQTHPGYSDKSASEISKVLRWNTPDWDYLPVHHEAFRPVESWLRDNRIYALIGTLIDELHDRETKKLHFAFISICQAVLLTLSAEGLFGVGKAREQCVINILMGDQDTSWVQYAQILNPPLVFERWFAEVKEAGLEEDDQF